MIFEFLIALIFCLWLVYTTIWFAVWIECDDEYGFMKYRDFVKLDCDDSYGELWYEGRRVLFGYWDYWRYLIWRAKEWRKDNEERRRDFKN